MDARPGSPIGRGHRLKIDQVRVRIPPRAFGGEGELTDLAQQTLERLGWHAQPLNTGRHDAQAVGRRHAPE
jgi:hypothetical protein